MRFPHDTRKPSPDRRREYERADEAREKKREEDAAEINPAATKWRYRPLRGRVKMQK